MNPNNPTPAPVPTPDEVATPRTDAQPIPDAGYTLVSRDFARTLERELLSAQAALAQAKAELAMATDAANKGDKARGIADAQAQQIIELKAALAEAVKDKESLLKTVDSLEADAINLHCALQSTAHMDSNDSRIATITGQVVRDLLVTRNKARAAITRDAARVEREGGVR